MRRWWEEATAFDQWSDMHGCKLMHTQAVILLKALLMGKREAQLCHIVRGMHVFEAMRSRCMWSMHARAVGS